MFHSQDQYLQLWHSQTCSSRMLLAYYSVCCTRGALTLVQTYMYSSSNTGWKITRIPAVVWFRQGNYTSDWQFWSDGEVFKPRFWCTLFYCVAHQRRVRGLTWVFVNKQSQQNEYAMNMLRFPLLLCSLPEANDARWMKWRGTSLLTYTGLSDSRVPCHVSRQCSCCNR